MPALKRVKAVARPMPKLVAVIMSAADLRLATKTSPPPDFFELRLDSLIGGKSLGKELPALPAPLIITARDPAEGGKNRLPVKVRRDLLLQFLPSAQYVDIELRSVRAHRKVIERARRIGVGTIISFHDLDNTPSLGRLRAKAKQAARFRPAVVKLATRTDEGTQLKRLVELMASPPSELPMAVMGIGKLGQVSRLLLAQCGSKFVYTSLRKGGIPGQIPLEEFRRLLREITLR
jgi:3-dehydroquinate dehydratase type I